MNIVIYGAGNIGRGFIAPLFSNAGYRVIFIDASETLVNALNKEKTYPVRLLSNEEYEETWVSNLKAINCSDETEAVNCILKADIMATAVGVRVLPLIAPVIAKGLKKRFKSNTAPLNIIICENLINADSYLAQLISDELDAEEKKKLAHEAGFIAASIGRMVPIQTPEMQQGNILRICAENYSVLPVNKNAFIGEIPKVKGMVPYDNFDFYIERKLFIHNMGHALCAYFGLLLNETYISGSIEKPDVHFTARNAMLESASALCKKNKQPLEESADYTEDLLRRFKNRALMDTCKRVGSDIERKLGPSDRLIGAVNCCIEQEVYPRYLSQGAAAAVYCLIEERSLKQNRENALTILQDISKLHKDSPAAELIIDNYNKILQGRLFN